MNTLTQKPTMKKQTINQLTKKCNKLQKALDAAETREILQMLRAQKAEEKLQQTHKLLTQILK